MIKTLNNNNPEKLNEEVFKILISTINRILEGKDRVVLGIPGGNSVAGLFKLFRNKYSLLPWGNIHVFMTDERIVPLDDKYSNFKQAKKYFIEDLLINNIIDEKNIHPFIMNPESRNFGVSEYCEELKSFGGKYDIVILGAGEDGHVAALFPNHYSLSDNSEYYVIMTESPKPPNKRFTMSRNLLLKCDTAFVYFLGENKKNAYNNYLDNNVEIKNCPVKLINQLKTSYIITDLKT